MYMTYGEIIAEQKTPLDYKIDQARRAIQAGVSASRHKMAIAFSGGKDSTVLWDLFRRFYPAYKPEIIFGNTGVEFPESLKFARKLGEEWGGSRFHETTLDKTDADGLKYSAQREVHDWLVKEDRIGKVLKADGKLKSTGALEKAATPEMWEDFRRRGLVWPKGTKKSYWWCCDQYGFPILGKAASKLDARRINIDCFLAYSKSVSEKDELLGYYEILKTCRFSQHCCKCIKKGPSEKLQAVLDIDVIFKGLMAAESKTRLLNFATRGYLFQSSRPYLGGDSFYHCNPLSIWTDDDIWAYIRRYNVPYSPLYDMTYKDSNGVVHNIKRNGCVGCATDILHKNNHMAALRQTHGNTWRAVMNYGMAAELGALLATKTNGIPSIISALGADRALDERPCAFDDIAERVDADGLAREYDAEFA
jgi:3'-phosphoadenosine 5'-phosphosulfate sulfotransferase (PAPS reductase)/FAD synthetase